MEVKTLARSLSVGAAAVLVGGCGWITGGGQTIEGKKNVRVISVERDLPFPASEVWQRVMLDFGGAEKFNPKVVRSGYLGDARAAVVGATRFMYYDEEGKQGIHERLDMIDAENMHLRFSVLEARDLPIDTAATFGESQLIELTDQSSRFKLFFYYRTTPRFLAAFAEGGIRQDLTNMTAGIEHYLSTGQSATPEEIAALVKE